MENICFLFLGDSCSIFFWGGGLKHKDLISFACFPMRTIQFIVAILNFYKLKVTFNFML